MRTNNPAEFSVCMGWDAFRLCIGQPPKHFSAAEVIRWLTALTAIQSIGDENA